MKKAIYKKEVPSKKKPISTAVASLHCSRDGFSKSSSSARPIKGR